MTMKRVVIIDPAWTGNTLECPAPEGTVRAERHEGAGVVLKIGDVQASISSRNLADVGRYFLAAAALNGEDVS